MLKKVFVFWLFQNNTNISLLFYFSSFFSQYEKQTRWEILNIKEMNTVKRKEKILLNYGIKIWKTFIKEIFKFHWCVFHTIQMTTVFFFQSEKIKCTPLFKHLKKWWKPISTVSFQIFFIVLANREANSFSILPL